jgi:hypothetical protein
MPHPHHPDDPYALPPDLRHAAQAAADDLRKRIQYIDGNYLVERDEAVLLFDPTGSSIELKSRDLMHFLSLNRKRTLDSVDGGKNVPEENRLAGKAGQAILRIVVVYFDELRKLICKGKKGSVGAATQGVIAALVTWLTGHMGVDQHAATGVAVGILITLLSATKGAFCRLTEDHAKALLADASKSKPTKK